MFTSLQLSADAIVQSLTLQLPESRLSESRAGRVKACQGPLRSRLHSISSASGLYIANTPSLFRVTAHSAPQALPLPLFPRSLRVDCSTRTSHRHGDRHGRFKFPSRAAGPATPSRSRTVDSPGPAVVQGPAWSRPHHASESAALIVCAGACAEPGPGRRGGVRAY
jgi:hypothetical protein